MNTRTCYTCNKFVKRMQLFCKKCGEREQASWNEMAKKIRQEGNNA